MKLVFIVKIGVLSLVAVCLSCFSGCTNVAGEKLSCRSMQVKGGYGYVVVYGTDTLIYQPYIPAIGEKITFASEEDALKIGRLVCRKLAEKQPPTVSREEIVENLPSMHLPVAGH
jgi:hypothetical protein